MNGKIDRVLLIRPGSILGVMHAKIVRDMYVYLMQATLQILLVLPEALAFNLSTYITVQSPHLSCDLPDHQALI